MAESPTGTPVTVDPDDFLVFLAQTAPKALDELTTGLAEVVAAVNDTGKSGSLTYKVKIAPAKGVDGMVLITDDVTTTIPQEDREAVGMFYVAPGGNLSDFPPGQTRLFDPSAHAATAASERAAALNTAAHAADVDAAEAARQNIPTQQDGEA